MFCKRNTLSCSSFGDLYSSYKTGAHMEQTWRTSDQSSRLYTSHLLLHAVIKNKDCVMDKIFIDKNNYFSTYIRVEFLVRNVMTSDILRGHHFWNSLQSVPRYIISLWLKTKKNFLSKPSALKDFWPRTIFWLKYTCKDGKNITFRL